jgi:hypothetical protein
MCPPEVQGIVGDVLVPSRTPPRGSLTLTPLTGCPQAHFAGDGAAGRRLSRSTFREARVSSRNNLPADPKVSSHG